ncbi:hypothetical protein ACIBL8_39385 [Streptomyces sp. NPDC050523]|uniref:hypothetical protein n=1 Tax=Streptomyces sp. NPDC050523 TaxID=3365622 RepID=UPI00379A4BE9
MNTKTKLGAALGGTVLAVALTATGGTAWAAPAASTATASAAAVTKLSQADAANRLRNAGITWSSSGNCTNRNNAHCTSFEQINLATVQGAITLKNASRCALTITGGTETGHASGTYSHWNGYKLDFNPTTCLSNYITGTFTYIGPRAGDGAPQYRAGSGNIYARESNHWDVLFYSCGC